MIGLQWSSIPHCSLPYSAVLLCTSYLSVLLLQCCLSGGLHHPLWSSMHSLETVPTQWSVAAFEWSSIPPCHFYTVVLLCLVHPLVIDVFSYASLRVICISSPGSSMHILDSPHTVLCDCPQWSSIPLSLPHSVVHPRCPGSPGRGQCYESAPRTGACMPRRSAATCPWCSPVRGSWRVSF